jgi:hypothetical protein
MALHYYLYDLSLLFSLFYPVAVWLTPKSTALAAIIYIVVVFRHVEYFNIVIFLMQFISLFF